MATIKLEDLFGAISFSPVKYSYPNTVPQAKVSTFKNMGLTDNDAVDDKLKPLTFTSANVAANRRRSHEFGTNQLLVAYSDFSVKSPNFCNIFVSRLFDHRKKYINNGGVGLRNGEYNNVKHLPWNESKNSDRISAWLVDKGKFHSLKILVFVIKSLTQHKNVEVFYV